MLEQIQKQTCQLLNKEVIEKGRRQSLIAYLRDKKKLSYNKDI